MRILVLHGYGGNAAWQWANNWRLERLVWPLGVEFAYISGPVVAWRDGHLEGHGWQQQDGDWSESLRVLEKELRNGDFVGLLGHSQGASCIAMAAERMSAGTFPAGGVRFLILANGYSETDGTTQAPKIQLPSLHIMDSGEASTSLQLAARFDGAATVEHWGGHRLEINTTVARALLDFLGRYATAERRSAVEELQVSKSALCRGWNCTEWGPDKAPDAWWCDWCWSRWKDRDGRRLCDACGQWFDPFHGAAGRGAHEGRWFCGGCWGDWGKE